MATVRYFWHGFIHRDTAFMYLQYSRPLIYYLLQNLWKTSYTSCASIFADVLYWSPYSTDKFISYVVPGPSHWFFHFGEEILITWTQIGWVHWMIHNLLLPAALEAHESSGVTPCMLWRMMEFCTTNCRRFLLSPCNYDLFTEVKEGPDTTQEMNLSMV